MIGNRICAFTLFATVALLAHLAPAIAAPYDGSWYMLLVTTNGHCGKIKVGLAITGGRIKSTSGKFVFHPIHIAGQIHSSGQVKMNGVAGPRQAMGTGHFNRSKGHGKWNGIGFRCVLWRVDCRAQLTHGA
jgi:hypothetical protein